MRVLTVFFALFVIACASYHVDEVYAPAGTSPPPSSASILVALAADGSHGART